MNLANMLKKSLVVLGAAAPIAMAPGCAEEQRAYRLEVMQTNTDRVVGFKVRSNANEGSDTRLYYRVKAYCKGRALRSLQNKRIYVAPVKTRHPDSK